MSDFETYCIHAWLMRLLDTFLSARPIGKLVGLEMGFRRQLPGKVVIGRPDLLAAAAGLSVSGRRPAQQAR